jgi:hypothetical protein
MSKINKGDIVRLTSGQTCRVVGLPGTFMSNGSYEVKDVDMSTNGKFIDEKHKPSRWVKPNDIAYSLTTTDHSDPITNYFETIYGDDGEIHIVPKNLSSVELVKDENGFQTIKLIYDYHLHNVVNLLIGEHIINKKDENN